MKQIHLLISGYVQSVGFRRFVKEHARRQAISGWARNLPDGRVEVLAQGEKQILEKLLLLCRKGPFMAQVDSLSVDWSDIREEEKVETFLLLKTPSAM